MAREMGQAGRPRNPSCDSIIAFICKSQAVLAEEMKLGFGVSILKGMLSYIIELRLYYCRPLYDKDTKLVGVSSRRTTIFVKSVSRIVFHISVNLYTKTS